MSREKGQEAVEARRIQRGDRIVILPPDGYGDAWRGVGR